jgi:hypothetical protein
MATPPPALPLESPACPAHLRHPAGPRGWSLNELLVEGEEEGEAVLSPGGGGGGRGRATLLRVRAGWAATAVATGGDAGDDSFVVKACLVGGDEAGRAAVRD